MKKIFIPLVLGLMLLGACSTNGQDQSQSTSSSKQTLSKTKKTSKSSAPNFKVKDKNGKIVKLSDYRGKKVYINVWASWCGPCLQEMPGLEKLYQEYKSHDDLVFLSITSPNDAKFKNNSPIDKSQETILETAKEKGISYPILYDYQDNLVEAYSIRSIPTHILINSDGSLSKQISGSVDESYLKNLLDKLK